MSKFQNSYLVDNYDDMSNQLLNKIKTYLKNETNFINLIGQHDEDIILGRQELDENLLARITKWEEE